MSPVQNDKGFTGHTRGAGQSNSKMNLIRHSRTRPTLLTYRAGPNRMLGMDGSGQTACLRGHLACLRGHCTHQPDRRELFEERSVSSMTAASP